MLHCRGSGKSSSGRWSGVRRAGGAKAAARAVLGSAFFSASGGRDIRAPAAAGGRGEADGSHLRLSPSFLFIARSRRRVQGAMISRARPLPQARARGFGAGCSRSRCRWKCNGMRWGLRTGAGLCRCALSHSSAIELPGTCRRSHALFSTWHYRAQFNLVRSSAHGPRLCGVSSLSLAEKCGCRQP